MQVGSIGSESTHAADITGLLLRPAVIQAHPSHCLFPPDSESA
jgi:hypothetical protein